MFLLKICIRPSSGNSAYIHNRCFMAFRITFLNFVQVYPRASSSTNHINIPDCSKTDKNNYKLLLDQKEILRKIFFTYFAREINTKKMFFLRICMDGSTQSGPTKSIHLAFLFCSELWAKMLGKGDECTFHLKGAVNRHSYWDDSNPLF